MNEYEKSKLKLTWVKALRTYSSSDELSDIEDGDIEISVLGDKEVNSVITRLLQAVLKVTNNQPLVYIENSERTRRVDIYMSDGVDINDEPIGSDSNSENDFEVEAIRDYNIMSSEILNSTIEQLKEEIKSDKYIEASIIVAEAAGKGAYHADIKFFLRSNKWCVNTNELVKHVNKKILPGLCFDPSPTIC
ncbi:14102_t:CDS:2, partial [Dentiscutata heterogama]